MSPIERLSQLLEDHDGDDRCGCLNQSTWELATGEDPDLHRTIHRLSNCLANHPAGHTLRHTYAEQLDRPRKEHG